VHRRLESMLMLGFDPGIPSIDTVMKIIGKNEQKLFHKILRHYSGGPNRTLCGLSSVDRSPIAFDLPVAFCTPCLQKLSGMRKLG
jgi:hypothetical protein